MNPLLERVSVDPDFFFGKPHIRGQRIWVSTILDLLAGGVNVPEILKVYPTIEELDIYAAIAYGAEMSRDRPAAMAADVLRAGPQCRRRRPPPTRETRPADSRAAV
jgi:uncharacterized protein (DUF433 family)